MEKNGKQKKTTILFSELLAILCVCGVCASVVYSLFFQNRPNALPLLPEIQQAAAMQNALQNATEPLTPDTVTDFLAETFDLSSNSPLYVWEAESETNNVFAIETTRVTIATEFSAVDYVSRSCTLAFYEGDTLYYILNRPDSLLQDFTAIVSGTDYSSEGVYLDYIEYFSSITAHYTVTDNQSLVTISGESATLAKARKAEYVFLEEETDVRSDFSSYFSAARVLFLPALNSVSEDAFTELLNVEAFIISEGSNCYLEDGALIYAPTQTLLRYLPGEYSSITVGTQVLAIARGAFYGVEAERMTLPFVGLRRSVAFGDAGCFGTIFGNSKEGTNQLYQGGSASYAIPDSLTEVIITDETRLAYGAFSFCKNLASITLNEGITTIQPNVFTNCFSLKEIAIPASVIHWTSAAKEQYPEEFCFLVPEGVSVPNEILATFQRYDGGNGIIRYQK